MWSCHISEILYKCIIKFNFTFPNNIGGEFFIQSRRTILLNALKGQESGERKVCIRVFAFFFLWFNVPRCKTGNLFLGIVCSVITIYRCLFIGISNLLHFLWFLWAFSGGTKLTWEFQVRHFSRPIK